MNITLQVQVITPVCRCTGMLRPAAPSWIERLRRAAHGSDPYLDSALICLGILPPADLGPIRAWLTFEGGVLHATENADGHRIIEIHVDGRVAARINHDGDIRTDAALPRTQAGLISA